MGRDVPFDPQAKCDACGKPGAWNFMGDYVCQECYEKAERELREAEKLPEDQF